MSQTSLKHQNSEYETQSGKADECGNVRDCHETVAANERASSLDERTLFDWLLGYVLWVALCSQLSGIVISAGRLLVDECYRHGIDTFIALLKCAQCAKLRTGIAHVYRNDRPYCPTLSGTIIKQLSKTAGRRCDAGSATGFGG